MNELVTFELKPNFNILGQKYGKDVSLIVKELKAQDVSDVIGKIGVNKQVSLCDDKFILINEDFEIIENSYENHSVSGDLNTKVSINCKLTNCLKTNDILF